LNGQRVGSYEIVRMLARGGMAVVYLVRQPALDREVVLKRLDLERDDPTLAQRFVREARLAAALDHPNVVTLFDFFEHDGVPYIAMEYVAGGSLRTLVGTLELPQVLGVLEGTLAGLAHAERHGIAHRDLKPENVLLTRRGNVKIADFGIARAYNALSQRLTITGKAMGTPVYMAPEQAMDHAIGPQTDLYALGVIVFELLSGRPPFEADTPMGVLYCHVHKPPPALPRSVRPAVRDWVGWLLQKAPADRPQSAGEAWHALEEIAVAELGPYWRRAAPIAIPTADHDEAPGDDALTSTDEPATPETEAAPTLPLPEPAPVAPPPRPPRWRRLALPAGVAGVLGTAAIALVTSLPGDDPAEPRTPAPPVKAAAPYDFDGDGRPELVAAMLQASSPRSSRRRSGVVLIRRGDGWSVITERDAGMPGQPRDDDDFGSGLASGDFDRDGAADLAIGTPGRNRVSVLFGTGRGLDGGRRVQLTGSPGADQYGYGTLAKDMDGDGYDDLLVSAPGVGGTSGSVQLLRGGPDGLSAKRSRPIARPASATAGFGARIRTGDVDGDHHADLVEGAPAQRSVPGHVSYCRGSRAGPRRCRALGAAGGTSGLAVADVNGDRYADIVQGDSDHAQNLAGLPLNPGQIKLWLGGRAGPRTTPITLTQDTPAIPGEDEPGDEFGAVVEAGDLDADGFADMVVAATRENLGAGRITVIRGGRRGYATAGNSSFDQNSPNVPGRRTIDGEFGSAISLLNLSADRRLDLAVAARGEHVANARVMVVEGGPGVFAPDETRTRTLSGAAARVHAPRGVRIRLARIAGD
jgi:tRNA A-37 threonylcarbamoyl transferase component Bud32